MFARSDVRVVKSRTKGHGPAHARMHVHIRSRNIRVATQAD